MATRADEKTMEGRALMMRERAERARELYVRAVAPGEYHVIGGSDPEGHHVKLHDVTIPPCDCGDRNWREIPCKHLMAVDAARRNGDWESVLRRFGAAVEREPWALATAGRA